MIVSGAVVRSSRAMAANWRPILKLLCSVPAKSIRRSEASAKKWLLTFSAPLSSKRRQRGPFSSYGSQIWDRPTVHHAPKHGSWLNQAEIEISLFSSQCLGQRRVSNLDALRREINA